MKDEFGLMILNSFVPQDDRRYRIVLWGHKPKRGSFCLLSFFACPKKNEKKTQKNDVRPFFWAALMLL